MKRWIPNSTPRVSIKDLYPLWVSRVSMCSFPHMPIAMFPPWSSRSLRRSRRALNIGGKPYTLMFPQIRPAMAFQIHKYRPYLLDHVAYQIIKLIKQIKISHMKTVTWPQHRRGAKSQQAIGQRCWWEVSLLNCVVTHVCLSSVVCNFCRETDMSMFIHNNSIIFSSYT